MIDADDDVSSYSLMEICTVGLVWVSTVGLELACRGKQVVVAAGNAVHGTSFVHTADDPCAFDERLEALLGVAPGAVDAEIRRHALRFAYLFFVRMRIGFPLVRMPTPHEGVLTYNSPDELVPGRDAGLDRCARIVLDGEPACVAPTAADRARDTGAEDALLASFGRRRLTALAFAEEIIADATLLHAWAAAFDGRDDATLVIHTLAEQAEALVRVVTEAGLEGDGGPDLLAVEADAELVASVDAVFSRAAEADTLPAPRYDDTSIAELAA
jgi:hypothetical protein